MEDHNSKESDDNAPFFALPNGNNGLDLKHNYMRANPDEGHPKVESHPAGKIRVVPEAMTCLFKK